MVVPSEDIRGPSMRGRDTIISRVMRQRRLIHIALLAGVGLGITGAINSTSTNAHTRSQGQTFREASVYIFLVVTILFAIQTIMLAITAISAQRTWNPTSDIALWRTHSAVAGSGLRVPAPHYENEDAERAAGRIGARFDVHILAVIAVLFVAREAFFAATAHDFATQNKEGIWYPLAATTEYLAVCLLAIPGLLPTRAQLKAAQAAKASA
jgi:hypothetical protein